jgi:hypothetical protein
MEFSEKTVSSKTNYHLAGIIPIAGLPLEYKMPYPDCLLPVGPDYTMIEAAVVEAAFAGCDTIWVICNDDISPLIRYRIGDFIQDPVYFYNNFNPRPSQNRKRIPIFWVPVHPKDRDKRDCLSWSVIHGAVSCLKVSSNLSKWLIPDKYYVSFPYGIFDPRPLQKLRKNIKTQNNFYVSCGNKTVQDDYYTSFTFGKDEFIKYRKNIRKGTGMYASNPDDINSIPTQRIPIEERWSARFFKPSQVFTDLDLDKSTIYNASDFSNLDSWDSYREYMNTDLSKNIQRPTRKLFSYREFNSIAKDRT